MKYSLYLARKYAAEGWWDRAIRHYLTVLFTYQNVEQREIEFADEFRQVLENYCESGTSTYESLKAAINVECDQLMGAVFRVSSANVRSGVFDQWHISMINDKERNEKFLEALKNIVTLTDHVLDIGAGSGILSVYAASCGASKITAIEANPSLYQMTKKVLTLNGLENAKAVHDYSYEFYPEDGDLADVVVSEILDCCAFGEGVIPTFLDAHIRLATNVARFIPSNASLFATLLESPSVYLSHSFTSPSGKEYRSEYVRCSDEKPREPYWCTRVSDIPDAKMLSSAHHVVTVDFQNVNELHVFNSGASGSLKIRVTAPGTLHAISVHFRALIWGDQYIDTSKSTCWEQGIFPLPYPQRVNEGESVVLNWTLKRTRFDISVDVYSGRQEVYPNRELILRDQVDYRTLNNDMLVYAVSRLLPSVSKYSWNLNCDLTDEEIGIVRSLPHFLVDSKDFADIAEGEVDEGCSPYRLSGHGVLVSSERLSKLCRLQRQSLCGADLSPIEVFNLLEYRDIEISTFEHNVLSNEFSFIHLGEEDVKLLSKKIQVRCTSAGLVEGVLYWWQLDGYYSTRQDRGAFLIFKEPISVSVGTVVSNY
ncbi:unnamed protein product [Nippostrongylus brasiliensis]|uniref:Protein arginine N-methyltransferase 9 n=1 Tax=Nippostrongylus brasiliensis TaxID=27835 RepID=A0A0N4YGE2_NIPBR|nr:unnamed protein product [Nippostrongylus brasiliensis]